MILVTLAWLAAGLVLLLAGAEALVRGSSRLARAAGVSPLVIGLTVVAFGTSSPELAVSVGAALSGDADVAIGNVVGSNIYNVLLILGMTAIIAPLAVDSALLKRDVPIMIAASLLLLALGWDARLSIVEGVLLFALIVAYTAWLVVAARREPTAAPADDPSAIGGGRAIVGNALLSVGGLGLLVVGGRLLVNSATELARSAGVDELTIGLTVVAIGTSLPEIATSLLAAARGQGDLAIGNVVGSNVFNILGILGVASLVGGGLEVPPAALRLDVPIMIAAAVAVLPVCFTGGRIARWEGVLLLGGCALYTAFLLLNARQHPLVSPLMAIALAVVLPGAALLLSATSVRELIVRRRAAAGRLQPPT